MGRILRRLNQLRLRSFDRSDHAVESERSVENIDALAASSGRGGSDPASGTIHQGAPPNWIKPDDGRPRH
jgi:hypothetical protein